jgi:hypothetical protein
VCPDGCGQDLYNITLELRSQRWATYIHLISNMWSDGYKQVLYNFSHEIPVVSSLCKLVNNAVYMT